VNVYKRSLAIPAIAIAVGLVAASPARADDDSNESLRALTAQWWQWALSIPAASNPLADTTGAYCMVGQRGPVWFLAASITGLPVVRTCTIPESVALFFPVFNAFNFNSPDCGGQGPADLSVAEQRAIVAPQVDAASGLSVLLNNRPIRNLQRVRSEVFPSVVPPADLFSVTFDLTCLVPGQVYSPSVDDGYYVKLRALPVGQHHLSIRGTNGAFSVDAFYTLNVVKTVLRDQR
jgi:hypothetical protein